MFGLDEDDGADVEEDGQDEAELSKEDRKRKRKEKLKKEAVRKKKKLEAMTKLEGDMEKAHKKATTSKEAESLKLAAPLTTPQEEKVRREAVYAETKEDVAKWDAVVHSRRAATTTSYPLIKPDLSWVRALKALQNSMIFTPCWPKAGPTGGDGFALPAGICNLTIPTTFFAI